ncbi:Gfo/Idh/MocA family protein [Lederbergia citrea]|uniref:Gfo/Idh/MocA family protein n=1 Tax=Lederbergia citrea TaxID=2833581 RepID=UPI001BCA63B1|nr:Gfo/Idh/MocA family oxidoreductase [Lederbergia citrea]MBS4176151.1 Gfo/Idh/MocA family oxidoreductase [Lederbergia citrea]
MENSVSIVLIGIGGYGNTYLKKLLDESQQMKARIAGVVDIHPERSENYDRIVENNIPVFATIEEFYASNEAELAIISTPIHHHASQTCYALEHGSNVLCEKPMCASVEEANKIIEARNRTGKFVAIGFNWSYSPAVHTLKQDIMSGIFGKPKRMKTIVNWPRDEEYYKRNTWAGRLYSDEGDAILDSVANNATSHFLHHMFYLLGSKKDKSVRLHTVTAELYRANPIESFDTCAITVTTEEDIEVMFYATHAVKDSLGPQFIYEFEQATLYSTKDENGNEVIARFQDGSEKVYPDSEKDHLQKLTTCIEATAKGNHDIPCGPEAALPHLLCITAMHESSKIIPFPETLIKRDEETNVTWVEGLNETLVQCYEKWCLPSEIAVDWAQGGETIDFRKNKINNGNQI